MVSSFDPAESAIASTSNGFAGSADPVLGAVARWLDTITGPIPDAVQQRGSLAMIAWVVGPPLSAPTTVAPRF